MRPSRDERLLFSACVLAVGSTCARRAVGCILVDRHGHTLATGYNGPASGQPHCTEVACPGAGLPSGTGLDKCEAIHAEMNAIAQCGNIHRIHTAYCTTFPCINCVKMLLNTSCERIVYMKDYPHGEAYQMWTGAGRGLRQITQFGTTIAALRSRDLVDTGPLIPRYSVGDVP